MYTLLYLKQVANKVLLYNTVNSAQYYVAAWMGGEFGGEWIHVYAWMSLFAVYWKLWFSSVQSLSPGPLFATPWTAAHQTSLSITNSQSLLKLVSIESVMWSNHLILCSPLLLLPPIFPRIRVSSNESVLHIRCSKYWSFSFSISPSNEYSGLMSFRIDWLDLLAVQGTLEWLVMVNWLYSNIKSKVFYILLY